MDYDGKATFPHRNKLNIPIIAIYRLLLIP